MINHITKSDVTDWKILMPADSALSISIIALGIIHTMPLLISAGILISSLSAINIYNYLSYDISEGCEIHHSEQLYQGFSNIVIKPIVHFCLFPVVILIQRYVDFKYNRMH